MPSLISSRAALTAILAATLATLSSAEGTVNLGSRIATKEEIVNILKPKNPPVRRFVTRGLQLNSAAEQNPPAAEKEAPRSLSLTVNFEFDSARLTEAAIEQLTPVAEALAANELKDVAFTLEGHTDAHGAADYNLGLSDQRAAAVKAFLADRREVDLNRITALGKGETQLADPSRPYSKQNRRVVVIAE